MKKIIPEQREIYCDKCKLLCVECDYKHRAVVRYDARMKDYMWEYHQVPTKSFDLCDHCFVEFLKFIGDVQCGTS